MNARTWGCFAAAIVIGAFGVVVIGVPLRWYITTTTAVARIEAAGGTVGSLGDVLRPTRYVTFSSAPGGGRLNDAALAQLLPYLEDVQVLDLAGTAITDAALPGLLNLPQLASLELGLTAVTDNGLRALTRSTQLVRLDLRGADVTACGIATLVSMPNLSRVDVCRTSYADDELAWMQAAMPAARIVIDRSHNWVCDPVYSRQSVAPAMPPDIRAMDLASYVGRPILEVLRGREFQGLANAFRDSQEAGVGGVVYASAGHGALLVCVVDTSGTVTGIPYFVDASAVEFDNSTMEWLRIDDDAGSD